MFGRAAPWGVRASDAVRRAEPRAARRRPVGERPAGTHSETLCQAGVELPCAASSASPRSLRAAAVARGRAGARRDGGLAAGQVPAGAPAPRGFGQRPMMRRRRSSWNCVRAALCPANGRPAARARRSSSSPRAANRARRHAGRYTSTRGSLLALVCSLSGDAVCVTALGHTRTVHRTPSQQTAHMCRHSSN